MKKKEESFGQNIRSIRLKRKMTQKMLAEDLFAKCFKPY